MFPFFIRNFYVLMKDNNALLDLTPALNPFGSYRFGETIPKALPSA